MSIAVFSSYQQVSDNAGDPLNGGSVTVYEAGTTTPIQLYNNADLAGGHEATNPITLDAYGRHAITYFTAQAYKVLVKDSGGSTIFMRDNIDPGIPIGSGALAIANGGTGASSAATALSNLGGATSAELADVAADVAALVGASASTEKTHLATGTTAQRPATPVEGDVRRNTTDHVWEGYNNSAAYENFVTVPTGVTDFSATDSQEGLLEIAVQAEMETGTDTVRAVVPGRLHFHQSAAKAWADWGVTGTVGLGYNVASVTDNGVGDWTLNFTTSFSGSNYARIAMSQTNDTVTNSMNMTSAAKAVGSTRFINNREGGASVGTVSDPSAMFAVFFGDL